MSGDLWSDVDRTINRALVAGDAALDAALAASTEAGLPAINVAANQGKLLALLARATRARRVLEIGTLGGYSTIWMARALPAGGHMVTLELDPHHAEVAEANLREAGVADRVEVVVGAALDTLPGLEAKGGNFDLTFIDADKEHNADYFSWAVRLSTPGGLIIVDNVVRGGAIADPSRTEPAVEGVRRLFEVMARTEGVEATAVQTVGSKGHDGFALAWVGDGRPH
ncbi:MAG: O-methyltransferase [Actinomycetota bacterium]|nr:O-methyltransferase [Actinomycetota bacterium]